MHVVIGRVRAALAVLATVAATTLIVGTVPAHAAEPASETCSAADAHAAADAARKTQRKHMILGFAKTMASSMLPFAGSMGHGGVGAVASALGQAAAQTAASNAPTSAAERLAQMATATPHDCAA